MPVPRDEGMDETKASAHRANLAQFIEHFLNCCNAFCEVFFRWAPASLVRFDIVEHWS